jgi:hypothetical protein
MNYDKNTTLVVFLHDYGTKQAEKFENFEAEE